MSEERLPSRVMFFGEMVDGKGYSFEQEKGWMGRLEENLKEIRCQSPKGWREAAHKAGRWFRWAEGGAERPACGSHMTWRSALR